MRFSLFLILLAASIARSQEALPVIEVQVPADMPPMDRALGQARRVASGIYSEIGLHLRWHLPSAGAHCSNSPMHSTIVVTYSWQTPHSLLPHAMAVTDLSAIQGGACVTIFMDRLKPMLDGNPTKCGYLLGHVLAHEIAHVLQGMEHHSESGVLKARWSQEEILSMPARPLHFTPFDAQLILDGQKTR